MLSLARSAWDRIAGWTKNSRPGLLTKGTAEFTGCMLFHFLGSAMPTPATNAIALTVLVYYTAKLSGAHLNPALTTTFALLGYTNPVEVIVYWIAQVSGCIVGALWLAVLVPGLGVGHAAAPSSSRLDGCFVPAPTIGGVSVLGWEAICTFCFILPIFSVVWYTQSKSGYGNTGPLIVGLSLYSAASVAAPWTGAALNPARAIASKIVFRCAPGPTYTGYYVAGELVGAAIVPIAVAPWYGMSWNVMRQIHERAYSYSAEPTTYQQLEQQNQNQQLQSSSDDSSVARGGEGRSGDVGRGGDVGRSGDRESSDLESGAPRFHEENKYICAPIVVIKQQHQSRRPSIDRPQQYIQQLQLQQSSPELSPHTSLSRPQTPRSPP